MATNSNTRTIRFSEADVRDIDRFLKENQIFDFSTLARVAIRKFIENPTVEIKGINDTSKAKSRKRMEADV